jgi:hypothetical protein
MTKQYPNKRDCEHGNLKRSCVHCDNADLEQQVKQLEQENSKLYGLLADIRQASGDNGSRMQSELVEYIKGLSSAVSERDELNAQCDRLRDVVFDELDSDRAMDLLLEEPKQSLAEIQAKSIEDCEAWIDIEMDKCGFSSFDTDERSALRNKYIAQLKEGVK